LCRCGLIIIDGNGKRVAWVREFLLNGSLCAGAAVWCDLPCFYRVFYQPEKSVETPRSLLLVRSLVLHVHMRVPTLVAELP